MAGASYGPPGFHSTAVQLAIELKKIVRAEIFDNVFFPFISCPEKKNYITEKSLCRSITLLLS